MRFIQYFIQHLASYILIVFFSSNVFAQCTSIGTSLATAYNSDNSNKGVMFNVVATNTITLLCFDANMIGVSTGPFEIYYKVGTYVGSQSNAAAWTLLGTNTITSLGTNSATPMSIPINLVIPAGQTYGFYITNNNTSSTAGVRYTNNSGYTSLASDVNITIAGGIGKAYPFAADYNNRSFNGTIHYQVGNALPVDFVSFTATAKDESVFLEWKTESENNNDYFIVERSTDGSDWEQIALVDGAGTTTEASTYTAKDPQLIIGTNYYRLSQVDNNGKRTFIDTKAVIRNPANANSKLIIRAFPNPVENQLAVYGSDDELSNISIFNALGEDISSSIPMERKNDYIAIDLSLQSKGFFILKTQTASTVIVKE